MARDNSKQKPGQETQYPTINMEVFQLTYGALVLDLVRDLQSSDGVNDRLDKIGYNIGLRLNYRINVIIFMNKFMLTASNPFYDKFFIRLPLGWSMTFYPRLIG